MISARIGHIRANLPAEIALHYAIKANPMPALVQHLATLVDGFDVASVGELGVALDTPISPRDVSFAGPGKTRADLERAAAAGIVVHVESASEASTLARIGAHAGLRPTVAVRVNPGFQLRGSGMRMGGGAQQFGIDAESVPALLKDLAAMDLDLCGFHIFAGSQCLRTDVLIEAQTQTMELAANLAGHMAEPIRHLNIGGGFGIPYFPGDTPIELHRIGSHLGELLVRHRSYLPKARIILELGRYLVGEAGLYVTKVIDKKVSRGETFLITDGGLHHHLAASGNFGQVIRRNYPVAIGNRMGAKSLERANVVGCLCTPLDLLASNVELATAEIGDLVVIFQSGAYGLTASPLGFLGHENPREALV